MGCLDHESENTPSIRLIYMTLFCDNIDFTRIGSKFCQQSITSLFDRAVSQPHDPAEELLMIGTPLYH